MEERKNSTTSRTRECTIEQRARFDSVRYSSCWEDTDVLLKALPAQPGCAYLSIASAGDNSLALLSTNPSHVLAVDINPSQLAVLALKVAAFSQLSYEDMLEFLGVRPSDRRHAVYRRLRASLSQAVQDFWDNRQVYVEKGIIHIGKFEHYFYLFRRFVLPLVHNKKTIKGLLMVQDEKERRDFYTYRWNTLRWKLLFKFFFSRAMMGRFGRDPEFFKYVETDVADRIFKRAEYALTALETSKNPYLEYILTGNFTRNLPFYLRQENFQPIRKNLDKLLLFNGDLVRAFQAYPEMRYHGFNLSDIFEYMSEQQYKDELNRVVSFSMSHARLVYWNMLVERKKTDGVENKLKFLDDDAKILFAQDNAFFYKSLVIGETL